MEAVRLEFGWQPGLRAHVATTRTRSRTAETTMSQTSKGTFELEVEEQAGEGLRIRYAEPTFELPEAAGSLSAAAQAKALAQLADLVPDYLVTREGRFAGIIDLPAYQTRLQEMMGEVLGESGGSPEAERLKQMLTSGQALNASAAQQWNFMVGTWVGAQLALGQQLNQSQKEPVPMLPGQEILMNYAIRAKRRVPCERGGVERSCVELEMRSTSDPADMQRVIDELLAQAGGGSATRLPPFRSLEVEMVLEVVTEPDGLFPHSSSTTRRMRGTLELDGEMREVAQEDVTRYELEYP
jgi:hypothetical protein